MRFNPWSGGPAPGAQSRFCPCGQAAAGHPAARPTELTHIMTLRSFGLALLASVAAVGAAAQAAWPGPAFPPFEQPADIQARCDQDLRQIRSALTVLEKQPGDAAWLAAYDAFNAQLEDLYGPVAFVSNVHPDRAVRDAAEACDLRWQAFITAFGQNERLYRAAKAVQPADDIDRAALAEVLDNFVDAGAALQGPQRARAKALQDRINNLGQQFDRRLRNEQTKLAFDLKDLDGVPEPLLKAAKRNAKGQLLLGLDYPTYFPVLERATREATRERMWRAAMNQGGTANIALLNQIARLRQDYARLFGQPSYADFVLRRRMAGSLATTQSFLDEVKSAVQGSELADLAVLREAKAADLGKPVQQVSLQRWDLAFYTERVRQQRFQVDAEKFRPYFPPQASLAFVMRVAERMFGIRYERVEAARLWHPEAQAYAVMDATTGRPLAGLTVDLYPRDGKYGHAAVWSYRQGSTLTGRLPQAALVVNFDRRGLTLEELETLLHEFGHALHSNLSATRYALNAGTSVKGDFVEAPSQMLEDWVYDPSVLKLFQEVCSTCEPVPLQMIQQARAAKNFAKGIATARQHLYASFDLALHAAKAPDAMTIWSRMEGATPLGHVPQSRLPASFSHVAGGYAAGYYGYLWSLVVASDLRTAFKDQRLDPAVGRRYRDGVLGQGGQRPPADMLRDFLGRETNARAFYEDLAR